MANVLILYPLKAPQSQRFSGAFKGFKMETLGRNRLKAQFCISKNISLPLLLASKNYAKFAIKKRQIIQLPKTFQFIGLHCIKYAQTRVFSDPYIPV